jgi:probable O-glycosylation ligase (exosortase A-associated)
MRSGLLAAMGFTIIAVIGTYSRGALFALGVSGLAYALKSRSSIIPLVLGGMVIVALPGLVPSSWFERMSTINSYDTDSSFAGRVEAWKTSFNIAAARPTGGGFSSVNLDWVAQAYHTPGSLTVGRAAHSIYFEVLGDHGFVGLLLYLLLIAAAWYNTSAVLSSTRDRPELDWAMKLARMMQVSMIGFLVGGGALSMAYYDGFLIFVALTASLLLLVRRPLTQDARGNLLPLWRRPVDQDMRALAKMRGG